MDLCSTSRAQQNSILAGIDTGVLGSLIAAASRQIERYCHRSFALQAYTEYLSGMGQPYDLIQLSQYPVVSIDRLATRPFPVLSISNTDKVTNQRATVATVSSGLQLVRVASAVPSTTVLSYSAYPTISAMAAAVSALGNGWSATAASGYELFATSDFRPLQGAVTALAGRATVESYIEELQPLASEGHWSSSGYGWRLSSTSGQLTGRFPQGQSNIQCDYTAGYASDPDGLPDDIQEACVQLVKDLYTSNRQDWTVTNTRVGPYSQTTAASAPGMSMNVRGLLSSYVDHSKTFHAAD